MNADELEPLDAAILDAGTVDYFDVWFISRVVEQELGTTDWNTSGLLFSEPCDVSFLAARFVPANSSRPVSSSPGPLRMMNVSSDPNGGCVARSPLAGWGIAWFEVPE